MLIALARNCLYSISNITFIPLHTPNFFHLFFKLSPLFFHQFRHRYILNLNNNNSSALKYAANWFNLQIQFTLSVEDF